jgi:hypothetical protein
MTRRYAGKVRDLRLTFLRTKLVTRPSRNREAQGSAAS